MLSKEFERKIATLEDLPELREITWQMRAALEKAYKDAIKDLNRSYCSSADPKLKEKAEELRHSSLNRMAELELYAGDMFCSFRNDLRKLAEGLPYFSHDDAVEMDKMHWSIRAKERQSGD